MTTVVRLKATQHCKYITRGNPLSWSKKKKNIILKQKWLQPHVAHHIEFDIAVWMTNAADFLAYPLDL